MSNSEKASILDNAGGVASCVSPETKANVSLYPKNALFALNLPNHLSRRVPNCNDLSKAAGRKLSPVGTPNQRRNRTGRLQFANQRRIRRRRLHGVSCLGRRYLCSADIDGGTFGQNCYENQPPNQQRGRRDGDEQARNPWTLDVVNYDPVCRSRSSAGIFKHCDRVHGFKPSDAVAAQQRKEEGHDGSGLPRLAGALRVRHDPAAVRGGRSMTRP